MKKILFVLMLITIITSSCGHSNTDEIKMERPVISGVKTEIVSKEFVPKYYATSGTVKSENNSIVSSILMGKITSLNVKEGDKVSKGQVLLTIDSRDLSQKAQFAQAGINESQKSVLVAKNNKILADETFKRYQNLYKDNVITKQEFDNISTQKRIADIEYSKTMDAVAKSKAGLGEISVYKSYATVISPINGIVKENNTNLGNITTPGQALLTIEGFSNLEIEANIDESYISKVFSGMIVTLENGNKKFTGKIKRVIPLIDPTTRSFKIKISASGLHNGEYVKVQIPVAQEKTVIIPKQSIVQKGQLAGVYTVDKDNVISYRLIKIGKEYDDNVEILSGLNVGEKIITKFADRAVDGGLVK